MTMKESVKKFTRVKFFSKYYGFVFIHLNYKKIKKKPETEQSDWI